MIEELPATYEEDKGPSALEGFRGRVGKPLSLDYFMFSCLETEVTAKAAGEERVQFDPKADSEDSVSVGKIVDWHCENNPQLKKVQTLDVQELSNIASSVNALVADIDELLFKKAGDRELFLKELSESMEAAFPTWSQYLLNYFEWTKVKKSEETPDFSVIPPVGRFVPILLKMKRERERNNKRGQGRNTHSSRTDRGDRNDRGDRGDRKPPRRDKQPRPNNRSNSRGGEANPEREKEALAEVKIAIDFLRQNPKTLEYSLKPKNSFLRRLKNQEVINAGFESESTGEGRERAVMIKVKKED